MSRAEQMQILWTDKGTYLAATPEARVFLRREFLVVQGGKSGESS